MRLGVRSVGGHGLLVGLPPASLDDLVGIAGRIRVEDDLDLRRVSPEDPSETARKKSPSG